MPRPSFGQGTIERPTAERAQPPAPPRRDVSRRADKASEGAPGRDPSGAAAAPGDGSGAKGVRVSSRSRAPTQAVSEGGRSPGPRARRRTPAVYGPPSCPAHATRAAKHECAASCGRSVWAPRGSAAGWPPRSGWPARPTVARRARQSALAGSGGVEAPRAKAAPIAPGPGPSKGRAREGSGRAQGRVVPTGTCSPHATSAHPRPTCMRTPCHAARTTSPAPMPGTAAPRRPEAPHRAP